MSITPIEPTHTPPIHLASDTSAVETNQVEALIEKALADLLNLKNKKPLPDLQSDSALARDLREKSLQLKEGFKTLFPSAAIEDVSEWLPSLKPAFGASNTYVYLDNNPFLSPEEEKPSMWYGHFESIKEKGELEDSNMVKDLANTVHNAITFIRSETRLSDLNTEDTQKKYYGALYYAAQIFEYLETRPETAQKVVEAL